MSRSITGFASTRRLAVLLLPLMMLSASLLQGPLQPAAAAASASPTITGVSPNTGPVNGGTTTFILGSGLSAVTDVLFGGKSAGTVTHLSDTELRVVTPSVTVSNGGPGPGTVLPVIVFPGGQAAAPDAPAGRFLFTPVVVSVTPNSGLPTGQTSVTVSGFGFQWNNNGTITNLTSVCFGDPGSCQAGTSPTGLSDSSVTVRSPAHLPGTVDVYVVVNGVDSAKDPNHDGYTYTASTPTPAPSISSVSPQCCAKDDVVTIQGSNLSGADEVSFGNPSCGSHSEDKATWVFAPNSQIGPNIQATAPAHSVGTVDIAVHTSNGWSACVSNDQFTYDLPAITSVSPLSGNTAGGNTVQIQGSVGSDGFNPSDTSVDFGGVPACNDNCTIAGNIQVKAPPHAAGTVHIHVTNSAGQSVETNNDLYNYVAPTPAVSSVSPTRGAVAGGTSVTITGTGFTAADYVWLDSDIAANRVLCPSANCAVTGDTQVTFNTLAHAAGTVDLHVHTAGGSSPTTAGDQYTYVSAPTVTSVSPSSGPVAGGIPVIIGGSGYRGGGASCDITQVKFGAAFAVPPSSCTDGQFVVNSPRRATGDPDTVDVRVTTAHGGTSAITAADHFTYTSSAAVIAVEGTDGALWISGGTGFGSLGGQILGPPAVVGIKQSNSNISPLYIATGTDHSLWVRNSAHGWQSLTSDGPVYCIDNPAAAIHHDSVNGDALYVACQGGDRAVWVASTPVPVGTALPVFSAGSFVSVGGSLSAGPALADVGSGTQVMTVFANRSDGQVMTEPADGPANTFSATSWGCVGHVSAQALGTDTYFACTGPDSQLWYAICHGSCTGVSPNTFGGIVSGGPGISANTGAVRFFGQGADGAVWEVTLGVGSWSSDGGQVLGGVGAAPL